MNKVIRVRPAAGGHVFVEMMDGRSGLFDVRPYMQGDFFGALKDEAYFQQVRIFFSGIGWPNGQDLGPDTIDAELVESTPVIAA